MLVRYARRDRYVIASQWSKDGDHPMVRPYRNDWVKEDAGCRYCGKLKKFHGHLLVRDSDGELIVGEIICPGDWIVEESGSVRTYTDDEFRKLFAEVDDDVPERNI